MEIDSTLVWLDKMQRSKECGNVRRVRNVAGKATNEEKEIGGNQKRKWRNTKSDDKEDGAFGCMSLQMREGVEG